MSVNRLRNEVDTLILNAGRRPDMRMCCSIIRALKLRHGDIDTAMARTLIETSIKELS